ncbi:hypothetical protein [Micromonospora maritima]|uniref:hypothetical protein n=1 Tax=Micromonospora maritima TaxID=986711 RepID=UPI0031EDBDFC
MQHHTLPRITMRLLVVAAGAVAGLALMSAAEEPAQAAAEPRPAVADSPDGLSLDALLQRVTRPAQERTQATPTDRRLRDTDRKARTAGVTSGSQRRRSKPAPRITDGLVTTVDKVTKPVASTTGKVTAPITKVTTRVSAPITRALDDAPPPISTTTRVVRQTVSDLTAGVVDITDTAAPGVGQTVDALLEPAKPLLQTAPEDRATSAPEAPQPEGAPAAEQESTPAAAPPVKATPAPTHPEATPAALAPATASTRFGIPADAATATAIDQDRTAGTRGPAAPEQPRAPTRSPLDDEPAGTTGQGGTSAPAACAPHGGFRPPRMPSQGAIADEPHHWVSREPRPSVGPA